MNSAVTVSKRVRGSNFGKEEQLILIGEIRKYKTIIENKATNRISCNEKFQAWRNVEIAFNAQVSVKRSLQQLQAKYENLKTEVRKVMATKRLGMYGTGGGPCKDVKDDPVLLAILEIINQKTVVGLPSEFDSDVVVEVNEVANYDEKGISDTGKEASSATEVHATSETERSHSTNNMLSDMLFEPMVIDNLSISRNSASTTSASTTIITKPTADEILCSDNWSSYTPRQLKKPKNRKLRPTVCNPLMEAKEQYYRAKRLLLEKELESLKRKEERDEEEHRKKMILLDLEIEKKRNDVHLVNL